MRPGGADRVLFRADGRFSRLRFSPRALAARRRGRSPTSGSTCARRDRARAGVLAGAARDASLRRAAASRSSAAGAARRD